MAGLGSDDYREGVADNYAFIISKMLDEAITYEDFRLEPYVIDGRLIDLTLEWNDSQGERHYRTLWEKRDNG